VQPVVAGGTVYVGTLRGIVHAIDAETGRDRWAYQAGGPVLHACATDGDSVFFGAGDGKVYAVAASDGAVRGMYDTDAAVWNAPAIHDKTVYVGGRDGRLYAFPADGGPRRWVSETGGQPILSSPALDISAGRVYVGCEDMRVYAFEAATGNPVWTSPKLPGVSFRGYHPVVAPDGSVMITTQPAACGDAIQQVLLDMTKEVFGDFASWRHTKEENAKLRDQNFKLMQDPKTYEKQIGYLRKRLTDEPSLQTFFVLDRATGKQKFVAPVVYAESMNGTGAPPVVTPDGKVIVKYGALLRSRYEHYSPFLNVGYLDTATGDLTPVMDQSRTYGWHDSLLLVHDEQSQLSVGGRVLFNAHQDNVNAMDLGTLKGYPFPLANNVHEPPAGAAVGIWAVYLAGKTLPLGWEWFARGTAVYGGGSALDVPVVIAGDSFYYLPTHELNAGCVLLAYRSVKGAEGEGSASKRAPQPSEKLSPEQWTTVRRTMDWDWDTLASPRLAPILKDLPTPVPGTKQRPLTDAARAAVARIPDASLFNSIVGSRPRFEPARKPEREKRLLASAVYELISKKWRPLLLPAGKAPGEAWRIFTDPTETIYTLALAYPHLDQAMQARVQDYVDGLYEPGGPMLPENAAGTYDLHDGATRSAYDEPPEALVRVRTATPRTGVARLYPLWLWAHVTKDSTLLKREWGLLGDKVFAAPDKDEADCGNARLAGLIAAYRTANLLKEESAEKLRNLATDAARQRLAYELAHTEGGVITMDGNRAVFGRWRNLTPEVARLCRTHAADVERHLVDVYVDHHRPAWWLAWNVETLWANEVPTALPTEAQEIFAARAMILGEKSDALAKYVDRPWCRADEFYIQKLALVLHQAAGTAW
jgi:hypothetical protein